MKTNLEIINAFNRSASTYEQQAFVQKEIGDRLFERLSYLAVKPASILDLGCGTGVLTARIQAHYPNATVVAMDIASNMLQAFSRKSEQACCVQGDMMQLPFEDHCFDLVISNQAIHWAAQLQPLLKDIHRVLKPQGCFFFSTLGPSTFYELRSAFASVDSFSHTMPFMDMHDVGDALLEQAFLDPVMDREDLTVHFPSLKALLQSLKLQGVRNVNPKRNAGLSTPQSFKRLETAYAPYLTSQGEVPLHYEIIQGHAWKGQVHHGKQGKEVLMQIRPAFSAS